MSVNWQNASPTQLQNTRILANHSLTAPSAKEKKEEEKVVEGGKWNISKIGQSIRNRIEQAHASMSQFVQNRLGNLRQNGFSIKTFHRGEKSADLNHSVDGNLRASHKESAQTSNASEAKKTFQSIPQQNGKELSAAKAKVAFTFLQQLRQNPEQKEAIIDGCKCTLKDVKAAEGIERHEITINGEKYQINNFAEGAYNGPKTQDFIDRGSLMFDAARKHLDQKGGPGQFKGAREALDDLQKEYEAKVKKNAKVDPEKMQEGFKGNVEDANSHYLEVNKNGQAELAQTAKDIESIIRELAPNEKNKRQFNLKDLQELEKQVVKERGRPTIINVFQTGESFHFSMQEPASKVYENGEVRQGTTLPSTIRNQKGLVNYVIASSGTARFAEDGQLDLTVSMQGIRHSSLPPISIADAHQRQAIACENAKQAVIDQAVRTYGLGNLQSSPDEPLKVPMRTMMLLTAKQGDFVRNRSNFLFGKWKGESESNQLEETSFALNMYRNRTIEVEIDGKKQWLQADLSYMNLGTNAAAAGLGMGIMPTVRQQTLMNARGFEEFDRDCSAFLEEKMTPSMKNLHQRLEGLSNPPEVQEAQEKIKGLEHKHTEGLQQKYAQLESLYENPGKNKKDITRLKSEINAIENEILEAYKELSDAKRKAYLSNAGQRKQLEAALKQEFDVLVSNNKEMSSLRELYNLRLYAQDLYFHHKYEKPQTVMELQTAYIQAQNLMGINASFFCKSAEDRTGRLNNILEEREIYRSQTERYPLETQELEEVNRTIAPQVAQYSASLSNTKENSEAPGLQIGDQVNPSAILAKSGKASSQIAKKPFKLASKLEASSAAQTIIDKHRNSI